MYEYLVLATDVQGFRVTAVQVHTYGDSSYAYSGTVRMELGVPFVELIMMQDGSYLPAPSDWQTHILDTL